MSPWLSATLAGIGALIACANWYAFLSNRRGERYSSPVPFLGGVLLFVGLATLPTTTRYAWLGLAVDYGTLAGVGGLFVIAIELWQTSPFRLDQRFVAEGEGRSTEVRLFRGGRFTIQIDHDPPLPTGPGGARLVSTSMTGTWRTEDGDFLLEGHREGRELRIVGGDRPRTVEECPPGEEGAPDRMDGLELERVG